MNPGRGWGRVSIADLPLIVDSWLRLLWTSLRFRFARPPDVGPDRAAAEATGTSPADARGLRLSRVVSRASRLQPISATCLAKALVLRNLLARHRIPARLRIGVQREGSAIAAHAWVECGGQPLGETKNPAGEFRTLRSGPRP